MKFFNFIFIAACFSMVACGNKEDIKLDLSSGDGATAFADPLATDIVVELTSIPGTLGKVVDVNKDGAPDTYVYPSACGPAKAAACGYSLATKSSVDLDGVPKGYIYSIKVSFRNSAGTALYEGTGEVNTTQSGQTISVSVAKK